MSTPRLLLINPWIYDFSAYDLWSKPLGLLCLAGSLRESGFAIDYLDCMDRHFVSPLNVAEAGPVKIKKFGSGPFHKERVDKPEILNYVPRHYYRYGIPEIWFRERIKNSPRPDAILITSLMTYWYLGVKKCVDICRELLPGVPVILGGIYATLMPDHAREAISPDYLVEGPGEKIITDLLEKIAPAEMSRKMNRDENKFPAPALDLYPRLDYLILMTSRGCPFHCTFCATDKISGAFAERWPEDVFSELKQLLRRFHARDVAFYDDALLINKKKRIIPFLQMVIDAKLNLRFHTPNGLHAREMDEQLAKLFYQAGFKTIRLSFESVSPRRLADMKNKVTPGDLERAAANLEQAGYARHELDAYVLMGLPNQDFEEIYRSIFFVHSLGVKVRLASFSPIPGTVDYQRTIAGGLFPADADPLLMNNSVYPLHRSAEAYYRFHHIRQVAHVLNDAADRGVNLVSERDLFEALAAVASFPVSGVE